MFPEQSLIWLLWFNKGDGRNAGLERSTKTFQKAAEIGDSKGLQRVVWFGGAMLLAGEGSPWNVDQGNALMKLCQIRENN
ncbi:hypothetical protein [Candidatus Coxiella mudrowiae]|uniref:hypothetical protein n=1 Tax=Candidatus Coxiella mudrowiae TaxID=2054173 RepID=UPI0006628ACD|nr:hypothetical protein [Candidatus Coxiella mudrowiae]